MPRQYERPPILEALCEFRFVPAKPWDWTIPGIFYEKMKEDFPEKRQQNLLEVALQSDADRIRQDIKGGIARMQFVRQDGTALVQIGPDNLIVNHLRPYPGWASFEKLILEHLQIYRTTADPSSLARIGLRYINRIDVDAMICELEEYFNAPPKLPEPIPQVFNSFLMTVDAAYESPSSTLRFTFSRAVPDRENVQSFVLDLDISAADEAAPKINDTDSWLRLAHERLEAAFDAAFTEKTHKEIFVEIGR